MKRMREIYRKIPAEIIYILKIFIVTRIILTIIGSFSILLFHTYTLLAPWRLALAPQKLWLTIWAVWDSEWYLRIAEHGYIVSLPFDPSHYSTFGFFPLYPLIIKMVSFIFVNYLISGLIVSNICLILAAYFLYRLIALDYSKETAHASVKYLFLLPGAFVLSGVFTESLFLLLSLLCFYYLKKRNFLALGLFGILLGLTKAFSIAIVPALIVLVLIQERKNIQNIILGIISSCSPIIGLGMFGIYSFFAAGDFFAYSHVQSNAWQHVYSNPFRIITENLLHGDYEHIILAWFIVIVLILFCVSIRKVFLPYWIYGLLLLLFTPFTGSVISTLRYSTCIFALPLILAIASRKSEEHEQFLTVSLALLQGFLMVFWVHGMWFLA
jgi:Gpi18-like mannosyltransferase